MTLKAKEKNNLFKLIKELENIYAQKLVRVEFDETKWKRNKTINKMLKHLKHEHSTEEWYWNVTSRVFVRRLT